MPTIIITGTPTWGEAVAAAARAHDYTPLTYTERTGYVAHLADDGAALVLVDAGDAEWRFWTTTPKTSPATRRIPIVVVSGEAAVRETALNIGANFALTEAELTAQLPTLLHEVARVPDAAQVEAMERQCGAPLPSDAVTAIERFNAGEYYKQHDLFEALWMHETGPVRDLYRAILQVGIAYYQITRGNGRGALKMLLRSVQWLNLLPDVCQGVDIAALRTDAARVRAELERVGEDGLADFDMTLLKPVRRVE